MKVLKEQIKFFNDYGYLIINNFFSQEDLISFNNTLNEIIKFQILKAKKINKSFPNIRVGEELSDGIRNLEKVNHDFIADISDYLISLPETMRLLSNPSLKPVVNQLLNCKLKDPLYLTNSNPVLVLPNEKPGTGHTHNWHKDFFYTLPDSKYIQIWSPLVKASNINMGTLKICPGSHKNTWKGIELVEGVPNRHRYKVSASELAKYKKINVELVPGQMLFFHSGLIHSSGLNISRFARLALVGVFHKLKNYKLRPLLPNFLFKSKTPENYFNELYREDV